MATNFRVKRAKSFLFVALEFQNGLEYRHSDFKMIYTFVWLHYM